MFKNYAIKIAIKTDIKRQQSMDGPHTEANENSTVTSTSLAMSSKIRNLCSQVHSSAQPSLSKHKSDRELCSVGLLDIVAAGRRVLRHSYHCVKANLQ